MPKSNPESNVRLKIPYFLFIFQKKEKKKKVPIHMQIKELTIIKYFLITFWGKLCQELSKEAIKILEILQSPF